MTKVVINRCYGGFGLSIEAQKRIHELGCDHIAEIPDDEYFKLGETEEARKQHCEICGVRWENEIVYDDCHRHNDEARDCPLLVKVVEEMGEKANGALAELKVVEVPDDVEWEIGEYDGIEWVAEKHGTWG